MKEILTRITDLFYIKPLRFIPRETFRYGFVGVSNLLLGSFLYWFSFHFILHKQDTDLGWVVISAPVLAFLITFVITFFTGFYLVRTVAFGNSKVGGGRQLFRYAQVVVINLLINYLGLKLLVEVLNCYPTPSYITLQVVTTLFSYLAQRFYTFRMHRCD